MNKVSKHSGTEAHSSITNLFLYSRLKKSKLYKALSLSSVLHSLLFTCHELLRMRSLFKRRRHTRILGNRFFMAVRIYLTRLSKRLDKQNAFVLDMVTNRLQHFLNPYISGERWESVIQFITTPGVLENRLMKLGSGRLTSSSMDITNLLPVFPRRRISRTFKKKWSPEVLALFFNFKFNFVTSRSTRKMVGLGRENTYNCMVGAMYKKLDLFLEASEMVPQDIHLSETFVSGFHINPSTFFLSVGDILSYRASSRHSDMSVAMHDPMVARKWVVCLHTLFSLNSVYTGAIWWKVKALLFKLTNSMRHTDKYLFCSHAQARLVVHNPIFQKMSFTAGTAIFYRVVPPFVTVHPSMDFFLRFSNYIKQSYFFTDSTDLNFEIDNVSHFVGLPWLFMPLAQSYSSVIHTAIVGFFELPNLLLAFNRWVWFNRRSTARSAGSLTIPFYRHYILHKDATSGQLVKRMVNFSKTHHHTKWFSAVTSFLYCCGEISPFFVGVENLKSLQWSFFLNLKHNTLISFSYLRWRHLDFEYALFYFCTDISISTNAWLHTHDKVGSAGQYDSFIKYN